MPQRRRLARAALSTTAAAACLALATPAWASSTIGLNPAHEGRTAAHFNQVCDDERFAGLPAGDDGWHFVLPGKEYGDFESLTLTFNDGTAAVTVTIPDGSDAYPDFFYSTGGRNPRQIHAYLFTPAGWTLVGGSATVSGTGTKFNVSHTCAGEAPTKSPSPSPSPSTSESPQPSESPSASESPSGSPSASESPVPSGSASPSESATVPASPSGGEDLPLTGVAVTGMALTGVALVGGGAALMVLRRRRDRITFTS
ncbi:LPXTG cell wall anchor domain-containing protein [Micromonospora sp. NBC_01412]|uniref:LPXTG cell wall anchor domain-containing protein n=1 Tax=Micromonospora sp. NBC_01412 TaxID=2903590 RepID=UPI003253DA07